MSVWPDVISEACPNSSPISAVVRDVRSDGISKTYWHIAQCETLSLAWLTNVFTNSVIHQMSGLRITITFQEDVC